MKLSIVVPVYNEADCLPLSLNRVLEALPGVDKEIIIVDDGSTDGTRDWLNASLGERQRFAWVADGSLRISDDPPSQQPGEPVGAVATIKTVLHERNLGKGAALRTGFGHVTGEVIVVQDADLEYDPVDWARFWPLFARGRADVVYGSRFFGEPHRCLYYHHYLANKVISVFFSILYNQILSDLEVCYKMFTREVLSLLTLRQNDFGFEIEFSSNVARARGLRIYEVGISYFGRTYTEGKKINWKDGVKALFYLVWYRFA